MTIRVTWKRREQLRAKLRALAPAVDAQITAANRVAADEIAATARSYVTRGRTGKLHDSITVTGPGGSPPAYAQGLGQVVPPGAAMVTAGNLAVRYAHLVEFGTAPHITGGSIPGASHPGTPPRPFFFPAYRLVKRKHRRRISKAIGDAIRKVAKRG